MFTEDKVYVLLIKSNFNKVLTFFKKNFLVDDLTIEMINYVPKEVALSFMAKKISTEIDEREVSKYFDKNDGSGYGVALNQGLKMQSDKKDVLKEVLEKDTETTKKSKSNSKPGILIGGHQNQHDDGYKVGDKIVIDTHNSENDSLLELYRGETLTIAYVGKEGIREEEYPYSSYFLSEDEIELVNEE